MTARVVQRLASWLDALQHQFRQALSTLRVWFDPPIDGEARPLEIREAIIERIERAAEPAAAGRRVLPHNLAIVTVLAEDGERRAALEAALEDVDAAVRARLAEIRCPAPPGFEVVVHYAKRPRPAWRPSQRFSVEFDSRPVTHAPSRPLALPPFRITVLRGRTSEPSYVLAEPVLRIGRTAEPTDHHGRPRRNHVVFLEDGDDHSLTVGRAHASIQWDGERRQYRLFDDGSHNGTRVVRGATMLNVVAGNPVGVTLLSGDELQFGTAAVKIEIGSFDQGGAAPAI
jgi:hypothetical protein